MNRSVGSQVVTHSYAAIPSNHRHVHTKESIPLILSSAPPSPPPHPLHPNSIPSSFVVLFFSLVVVLVALVLLLLLCFRPHLCELLAELSHGQVTTCHSSRFFFPFFASSSVPSATFTPRAFNGSTWSRLAGVCFDSLQEGCWEQVNVTSVYSGETDSAEEVKWAWLPLESCPTAHVWKFNSTANRSTMPVLPSSSHCPQSRHFPSPVAQTCLANRWIVFIGDSSTRFLYSAFVQLLSGQREPLSTADAHMPAYSSCPCSANNTRGAATQHQCCAYWYKGLSGNETVVATEEDQGTTWFRERLLATAYGYTRLTFFFKTYADARVGSLEAIMTPPLESGPVTHPDLLVLNTGAWDGYAHRDAGHVVNATAKFLDDLSKMTRAPLLWLNLPHCHWDFQSYAERVNAGHRQLMRERGIPVLPREESTWQFLDEKWAVERGAAFSELREHCEGWHAHNALAEAHTQVLLNSICQVL